MVFKIAQQTGQIGSSRGLGNGRPCGLNRRNAFLFHSSRVHAGAIKVAVLLLQRRFRVAGRRVQFLPKQIAVPFAQFRERSHPARLVGGNGIGLEPVAARVLVEIRAGVGGFVDCGGIEALGGGYRLGLCRLILRCCERGHKRGRGQ